MTKPNYEDLSNYVKFLLLKWMKDGLYAHAKHAVESETYQQMILDMQNVRTFDIRRIYERLHEKTVDHVVHAAKYEILIDEELERIMLGNIDPEEGNESAQAPGKPKRKKRCKGA